MKFVSDTECIKANNLFYNLATGTSLMPGCFDDTIQNEAPSKHIANLLIKLNNVMKQHKAQQVEAQVKEVENFLKEFE